MHQAVTRGVPRDQVQPGSVTVIQRFGSALNVNLHFHGVFLEGVSLDRTAAGRTPRFVTVAPPSDADIATVLQKLSHRVLRQLRRRGYLEASMEAPVATGYDPLRDTAPELARTMAASVQQRIAFGARAGQHVRRIGAGFGAADEAPRLTGPRCASVHGFSLHAHTAIPAHRRDQLECLIRYTARGAVSLERLQADANGDLVSTFPHPWSDGTRGIRLAPLELLEKLAALVPVPRVHLVRYAGCLAPHSPLRGAIRPPLRQQGLDGAETHPATPYWPWARLLGRVFGLEMRTCPLCRRGSLHLIAVITQEAVSTRILRHLQLASLPPPLAPARGRQETCACDEAHNPWRGPIGDGCAEPAHPRVPSSLPCLPPPPVPRPAPPGHPGDAPQTEPASCPAGAGSCIQRRCSVQAAGFRGCAPADTGAKISFNLPIRGLLSMPGASDGKVT